MIVGLLGTNNGGAGITRKVRLQYKYRGQGVTKKVRLHADKNTYTMELFRK